MQGFVRPLLAALGRAVARGAPRRPVIGLQAPVGAGKTTLSRQLQQLARQGGIQLAVASIDDAYWPWPERQRRMAGNPFGVTRVPPGSHNPAVLEQAISCWRQGEMLRLPRFDKTLLAGEGDHNGWSEAQADALLLEGWMLGYRPVNTALVQQYSLTATELSEAERAWLPRWNDALAAYQPLWDCCDSIWVMQPADWSRVFRWRLQAEARQRRAGGAALSVPALQQLVRATLASLPPQLYQAQLDAQADGVAILDGQRRCQAIRLRSRPH
jgi:D-glycerate 3-kinase